MIVRTAVLQLKLKVSQPRCAEVQSHDRDECHFDLNVLTPLFFGFHKLYSNLCNADVSVCVVPATMGAIFGMATCLSAQARDAPDDPLNYFIGGCASGIFLGARSKYPSRLTLFPPDLALPAADPHFMSAIIENVPILCLR